MPLPRAKRLDVLLGAAVLTGLALAAASCTTTVSGNPVTAAPTNSGSNAVPGQHPQHLGDLDPLPDPTTQGAPFDPCVIVHWADFPDGARDAKQPRPTRERIDLNKFGARCTFEATKPTRSNPDSNVLVASVAWFKPGQLTPGASANPPSVDHPYAGKPGWRKETTLDGVHSCISYVVLDGANIAAVGVVNTRYPDVPPCTISDTLAETIAHRVP